MDYTSWLSGDVIANGIRIHYWRTGGEKPPVVLLHGITDNGLCWTRLARALEPEYDLVMVDARGHGLSEAPGNGYAAEDHAADVAGLVRALGLERPALVGHSMGAATAAVAAALYPDCTRGIVLEDPPWRSEPVDPAEARALTEEWRAGIVANRLKTVAELVALCREQSPIWDEAEWLPWAESKRQVSPEVVGMLAGPHTPWQETLRRIACRILLVAGDAEAGAIVTPEVGREATSLNARCKVVRIRGAGHNIRRERFGAYLHTVSRFLARLAEA